MTGGGHIAGVVRPCGALLAVAACAVAAAGCEAVDLSPTPRTGAEQAAAGVPAAPAIDRPVVDRTGTLSSDEVASLSARLRELGERTGAQMAVLLVWTTGEEPIEDYSMRVAEAWGGGDAQRDDGLLLTLALGDRRMRLEVGYGLEEALTDAESQAILDGMGEALRAGHVEGAIAGAIERVAGELPHPHGSFLDGGALASAEGSVFAGAPITLAALALALLLVLAPRRASSWSARTQRKARSRAMSSRPAWWWATLFGGVPVVALLFAWLHADLAGPSIEAAIAFTGATLALLAATAWLVGRAREMPTGSRRWPIVAATIAPVVLAVMGATGAYLSTPMAFALVMIAGIVFFIILPAMLFSTGGGGSYSSSSYGYGSSSPSSYGYGSSSSSSSRSSSSSSSSYSGHGGGFGGGGASSSW